MPEPSGRIAHHHGPTPGLSPQPEDVADWLADLKSRLNATQ